jgi:lysophospholipid hydrolase
MSQVPICDSDKENCISDTGRNNLIGILAASAWFQTADRDVLSAVASAMTLLTLNSGEVLFEQGAKGDSLYLIVSGRVRIVLQSEGSSRIVSELGHGEVVGEMALLSDMPRLATVSAMRDTHLARLDKSALEHLSLPHRRQVDAAFISQLVRRLGNETRARHKHKITAASVAIVPLAADIACHRFASDLANAFGDAGSALLLNARLVERYSGLAGASQSVPGDSLHPLLAAWLYGMETTRRKVIYEAEPFDSPWTARCLRQADIVLLVAAAGAEPESAGRRFDELLQLPGMREKRRVVVLLHEKDAPEPTLTSRWLQATVADRHFHVRLAVPGDAQRLGRFIDGKSVGLALGAGFARGIAHVGVIRAMRQLNIPIDMVGGTSIGAIVGSQCAMEWGCDVILAESCTRSMSSLKRDFTLPLVSLLTGARQKHAVESMARGRDVEDTWLPFFSVSSSLTRLAMKVHRSGSVSAAIIASTRVPGIFPPLPWEGELLVDGGLVNMVPIDVMRDFTEGGIVIGVDVSPGATFEHIDYGFSVSGWKQLVNKLNPFRPRSESLSFVEVLMRTVELGRAHSDRAHDLADAWLTPPLEGFAARDFSHGDAMAEIGYRYAIDYFSEWLARHGRPWEIR